MRRRKVLYFSLLLTFIFSLGASLTAYSKIKEPPYTKGTYVGEYAQAGRLRFGIGKGTFRGINNDQPNVQYIEDNDIIDHLYISPSLTELNNGLVSSSPFNIIENDDEYKIRPVAMEAAGKVVFPNGGTKETDRIVTSEGKKLTNNDFKVRVKMEADSRNTQVLHTYSITNISDVQKTIYPSKHVDTELSENDDVPIFSRGPGKGLYIESSNLYYEDSKVYRLDYITDVENGPISYQGMHQNSSLAESFGVDKDRPNPMTLDLKRKTTEVPEGEMVFGEELLVAPQSLDSGMAMVWGKKVLDPGQTIDVSYAVGISAATKMTIEKSVSNKTSQDDLSRVGDELEYSVDLTNTESKGDGLVESINIKDTLPKEVSEPTNIKLVKSNGETVSYEDNAPYDPANHVIEVAPEDMVGQDKVTLTYRVKVDASAAGKTIENNVQATGQNPNGGLFDIEAFTETDIVANGQAVFKYQDESGNQLADEKKIEATIGSAFDEKPIDIFGYEFSQTIGNPAGTIEEAPKEIIFVYKAKDMFTLKQQVLNADNTSLDQKEVGLDEDLYYKTELEPLVANLSAEELAGTYQDLLMNVKIDENLDNVRDLKLVLADGSEIGSITYDSVKNEVLTKISNQDKLNIAEKIYLSFTATVKSETPLQTVIKQKTTATATYVENKNLQNKATSNEVVSTVNRGELIFESAPKLLNFGSDNKISSKDTSIELVTKDEDLMVRDLRGKGNQWSMTVKLIDDLTNNTSTLEESLYYVKDGNEQIISKDASASVYQETTNSNDAINISNQWSDTNKPIIKVKAGQARVGNYEGTIQWSLQDVPIFDE